MEYLMYEKLWKLSIDMLPKYVLDAVLTLRFSGKGWIEIEQISSLPYGAEWAENGGGFVDWVSLSPAVLALFPGRKLPHSSLHRWYDLRVSQGVPAPGEREPISLPERAIYEKT
jgi:hypothetical protein